MKNGKPSLSPTTLQNELWTTLTEVRKGTITPAQAQAIAAQARGIVSIAKFQLTLASQLGKPTPRAAIGTGRE